MPPNPNLYAYLVNRPGLYEAYLAWLEDTDARPSPMVLRAFAAGWDAARRANPSASAQPSK